MQLTRAADYAVRVMIHFATLHPGTRVTRATLAEATGLPDSFLAKILQSLSKAGFIRSSRGLDGGFVLAADTRKISIVDVVEAIESRIALNLCLVSGTSCSQQLWCAAHLLWAQAQAAMLKVLRSASIADLASQTALNRKASQPSNTTEDPVSDFRPCDRSATGIDF